MQKKTNEVIFDKEKLSICLSKIKAYFKNIDSVSNVEYPKEVKYRSHEWLVYIFYSCLLDYGMKSKLYHERLIQTYHNYKDIFNPKLVKDYNENELLQIIKNNIHPRYPNVALKKWLNLANVLENYDNLLEKIQTFNHFSELVYFIQQIKGYGQKTGGLLLRLIAEANICSFDEEIPFIPLDRHDIEISYLNGIINKNKLNEKNIRQLSNLYIQKGRQLNISPCDVDKYLWEIGNSFCNKKACVTCPLQDTCKKKI